jgi:UDP-3-O-[3-hydroxymyristoyl] glucosamine N-acyltransferase
LKLERPSTLQTIAGLLNASFKGEANLEVLGINEIHRVEVGDIVFVDHPKYYDKALNSNATIVIINKDVPFPAGKGIIITEDPFKSFNFLTNFFKPFSFNTEQVADTASIGNNCRIHSTVVIGDRVKIGNNCIIHPNVTIYDDCEIGNNVIIHANTVIGGHAFYYKRRADHFERLNSCGTVVIENDVEIGASCTIDRGVTAITQIGAGTKIDNMVQIGHDTIVGKMCLFAAHVGIAGCVIIEDNVTLWGQVGIVSGITLKKGTVVLGQSGISKDTKENTVYLGSPADESRSKMKEMAALRRIPTIIDQLKDNK